LEKGRRMKKENRKGGKKYRKRGGKGREYNDSEQL
jgi:hypothetical protein